jgi:hypothetical protein
LGRRVRETIPLVGEVSGPKKNWEAQVVLGNRNAGLIEAISIHVAIDDLFQSSRIS